ncbi:MAG: glycine cleavage T C-terminal barrel domain-containing protein, partial [Pseudomonadota bacterium]
LAHRDVGGAMNHPARQLACEAGAPANGNPMIGPAPGAPNYWCCCGTQIGIGWGPGLTRELARWMVHGAADISMREFDPRRFGDYAKKDWQVVKAKEDYCLRHEIPFPHFNRLDGRPIKPSPLYERLKDKGAVYEEVYGHERPRWFARDGVAQEDHYSFRRTIVHDMVAAEVKAVRDNVGIMDISAFSKIEVAGDDAEAFLDRLVANRLPKKVGGIALTHLLNRRGRIEIELTIVRIAENRFYLVCAAFFEQRLIDHLEAHRGGKTAEVINRSTGWAAIALQGPKSREVLAANTDAKLDNASFRWLSSQLITIAGHEMLAMRMSYAGELGWEIHGPSEHMLAVYDALWSTGEAHGIADYGSFAMNGMRMEKAFKGAGELTNEVTLPEADVMRFVKLDKGEFLGKAETQTSLDGKLPWICAYLSIDADGDVDGNGSEAVLLNGQSVGLTSSVAYGHSVGSILAFAYVKPEVAIPGTEVEVVLLGEPRKARILGEAAYDPENIKPRTDA